VEQEYYHQIGNGSGGAVSTGEHSYTVTTRWTGNRGDGTASYRAYDRTHEITAATKPTIPGSSDPAFRGDSTRYNPEDLLVASLSACHMLTYLHLCSAAGVNVSAYVDEASGTMAENATGGGRFREVVLRPHVTITIGDEHIAHELHHQAHDLCFIASSVNFAVRCEPQLKVVPG
jgi:organic hydroperoxide reductase OsmC/OhrA